MPEVEVSGSQLNADLSRLEQLASQTQVPILGLVLNEVLALENNGRIRKHLSVGTSGWARRYIHADGKLYYDVAYQADSADETIRLGNLVHELTHCAVNEAYDADFLNHASDSTGIPDIVLDSNRFVENETKRRTSRMDMTVLGYLGENLGRLKKLLTQSGLSEKHKTEVSNKIDYGMVNVYVEYDTVINQIGFWCLEWGARRGTQFSKFLDALGEDAYERRQTGNQVIGPLPDPELQARCCYITTACTEVMGLSDDCEALVTLRNFRDDWLQRQVNGEEMIKRYYDRAPEIVEVIQAKDDASLILKSIFKNKIEPAVRLIQTGQEQAAFELYVAAIHELESMIES
jgi:hypothetical protein